jgi:hypothetical protein
LNENEKNLVLQEIMQAEKDFVREARTDAFQVPKNTPRFGAFAEDDPETHLKHLNPNNPDSQED